MLRNMLQVRIQLWTSARTFAICWHPDSNLSWDFCSMPRPSSEYVLRFFQHVECHFWTYVTACQDTFLSHLDTFWTCQDPESNQCLDFAECWGMYRPSSEQSRRLLWYVKTQIWTLVETFEKCREWDLDICCDSCNMLIYNFESWSNLSLRNIEIQFLNLCQDFCDMYRPSSEQSFWFLRLVQAQFLTLAETFETCRELDLDICCDFCSMLI